MKTIKTTLWRHLGRIISAFPRNMSRIRRGAIKKIDGLYPAPEHMHRIPFMH